ncbi:hypothetical protein [Chromobacterium sinusclupearum]|uniref:hypothetical protein n=1 Tax=Chromobacterium sinusclupearum TaxID=2077146 RepID=UPI0011AFA426|nr:hypothetical protein [Chromobacterium sinusclupearum]
MNMMNLYQDMHRPPDKKVRKDIIFWIFFLFWPFAGAVIAYIYISSGYHINGILAFTTGLSAPSILQTLMSKTTGIEDQNKFGVEE